ncbi:MAG: cobalamin biosynthesis protein [Gammaproteobacteria bacterium]|nr:MAG: cobalamin biosynthesis protein [Gammaproteobacteria bacterium]
MLADTIIIIIALSLDWFLGEPKRYHPLVGFGYLANKIEAVFYSKSSSNTQQIIRGFIAVLCLLMPLSVLGFVLAEINYIGSLVAVIILTLSIGNKSLHQHSQPIADNLESGNNEQARYHASRIVSRDPATLHIPRAAIESVLENGADSVFSALFWFLIAGIPGVIFYRLSNTLDAMWGYRNSHYLYFGRFAARLDDVLNYIPARLTALSYAVVGKTTLALRAWRTQASQWDSPNAGPVMASGAGALNITLGGPAQYDSQWHQRILLGYGDEPTAADIYRALRLLRHSIVLWVAVLLLISVVSYA